MSSISFRLNRRGATLPLTTIVLALMAVAVAVTYSRISSERAITGDAKAQQGAFAVAQSGLNRFLANLNGKPPAAGPWPITANYVDLPGGTAQVDMMQLRDSTPSLLPAVYVITSRGRYTAAKRYNSLSPSAERTVATYALWVPAPLDVNGAFTSLTQVEINGNSYTVSGVDRCGAAATTAGLAVPDGDVSRIDFPANINGNPDDAAANLGTPGPGGTAKEEVEIDWAAILAGSAFPADYVYPTNGWPAMTSPGMADWPVTRVNGDLTLPGSGKGILIVTGNLTWNGTPLKTWEGLVLVGGTITANGQGNIYGALVTGLNVKTGTAVGLSDLGNGTKNFLYDSCALARALGHIGSIQRVRNGWTDTWSSY
jgi:hypothetical protein